jgi:sodium pump decarboxylase gamma subunit
MSNDIWDAVILIVIGMAVVFAALIILMVAIMLLNRLFPDKGKKTEEPTLVEAIVPEESEREKVAALAVALAMAIEQSETAWEKQIDLGDRAPLVEASRWAVAGRESAMRSRQKAGRQWGRRSD